MNCIQQQQQNIAWVKLFKSLPGPPRDVHEVRNAFRGGRRRMYGIYNAHRRVVHAIHPRRTPRGVFGRGKIPGVVTGGLNRTACII
jgi:hypothetical protein